MKLWKREFSWLLLWALVAVLICGWLPLQAAAAAAPNVNVNKNEDLHSKAEGFFRKSGHTNNWAVLVNTSRFWFNYRHGANVLSFYRTVKRLGIPDSQILVLMADDFACNPRNGYPAQVFNHPKHKMNLYGDSIEIDYRGYDVNVENFIRLLTDRVDESVPRSKRLLTDDRSNILIYMTGHGGDEFLKFQDAEELSSFDLADAFEQMWQKRRYHEILFMIDTCQANTMFSRIYSPNILAVGSSEKGQNSYSYDMDNQVGLSLIDRFTYQNLEILEKVDQKSEKTVDDLFKSYSVQFMGSTPGVRSDLFQRPLNKTLITDFFGSVQGIELTGEGYPLAAANAFTLEASTAKNKPREEPLWPTSPPTPASSKGPKRPGLTGKKPLFSDKFRFSLGFFMGLALVVCAISLV